MSTTARVGAPAPNPAASNEENIRTRWQWLAGAHSDVDRLKLQQYESLALPYLFPLPFKLATAPMAVLAMALVSLEPQHIPAVQLRMHWIVEKLSEYLQGQPEELFSEERQATSNTPIDWCARRLKILMKRGVPSHIIEFISPDHQPGEFLTEEAAERNRLRFATTIIGKHRELKKIWAAHQQTIQKRWKDKSQAKRQKILTDAWPNINPKPWMALETWLKNKNPEIKEAALYWPSINLENWSEKDLLLKFLQMRVEYPPDYLLGVDRKSLEFGYEIRKIHQPYLYGFVMQFLGSDTAEDYGKLISIENRNGGQTMSIGHGLLTMKVQAHTYTTLLACCMNLLTDEEKKSLTDQGPHSEPSTSSKKGIKSGSSKSSTMPVAITNQLCQLSGRPNFDSLLGRVGARLEYAKDHLWALREDPGQFGAALGDCRNHEAEFWKAEMKKKHPNEEYTEAEAENDIVSRTVLAALDAVTAWNAINTSLQSVRELMDREEIRRLGYRDEAPLDLQTEWCEADYFVDYWIKDWSEMLTGHLEYSPLMRDRQEKKQEMIEENKKKSQKKRKKERQAKTEEQILEELYLEQKHQHILAIIDALKTPKFTSLEMFKVLIDRLDAQLEKDQAMRQCITPFVQRDISHLSLLLDCRAHLRLIPWAPVFLAVRLTRPKELPSDGLDRINADQKTLHPLSLVNWKASDAWVTEKDLEYPVEGNRTKETVEKLQKAESVLDKFWKVVDADMKKRKAEWPAYVRGIFNRTPERTADWVEPPVSGHKRARTETRETVSPRPTKKAKRKGIADPARATPQAEKQEEQQEEPEEQERMYEVNRRTLDVFDMVFFKEGMSGHAGEMRWSEFVRALNAIGFKHQPAYGSAVFFEAPNQLKKKGGDGIEFHAPHDGKLPFLLARRLGYRLRERYGLHHGVFHLKS